MKTIEFELKSICPLKMDKYVTLAQPKDDKGYLAQAKEKVYRDTKGNLAIPASAIKATMREACSELGKRTDGKRNRQDIKAYVFIEPDMLSIGKKEFDEIDKAMVTRGQGAKVTRVPTYRPLIKEWVCKGKMHITNENKDLGWFKDCLTAGGLRYGLLSHRPEFGRYVVSKFEVIKSE